MEVKFDGNCGQFLNYPNIDVYRQGESAQTPFFLFYINSIENKKACLAPVSAKNKVCLTNSKNLFLGESLILVQIDKEGKIVLHPNKSHKETLGDLPKVSWMGHNQDPVDVKEDTICVFSETNDPARRFYSNFLNLLLQAIEMQKKEEKKSGCTIL